MQRSDCPAAAAPASGPSGVEEWVRTNSEGSEEYDLQKGDYDNFGGG